MGGNALKHLTPLRITSDQMQQLWARIQLACMLTAYDHPLYLVPWPALSKHEHGDMDIIVDDDTRAMVDLHQAFNDLGVVRDNISHNGGVYSVPVPFEDGIVQVDFICAKRAVRHHRLYYAGGGFGAMIGRVADWMGLVFAMDGLRFRCTGEPWSLDIPIADDPMVSLRVLGYTNPHKLLVGMTAGTEPELWEFVMTSPYARPECFMPENTNADNRSRDRQRPGYQRFQAWLQARNPECTGRLPRWSTTETMHHLRCVLGDNAVHILQAKRRDQEETFNEKKNFNAMWGRDAAAAVLGLLPDGDLGNVIERMQDYLPGKADRTRFDNRTAVIMAQSAAFRAGVELGFKPRTAP